MITTPDGIAVADCEIIASVSGGKDSTALALHLREIGLNARLVFSDTGWESSITYDYISEVLEPAIGPIHRVAAQQQMIERIRHKGIFPSRERKWCTQDLKVAPIFGYIFETIAATGRPVINAVGVRAQESRARAALPEWDGYRDRRGEFVVWRPLIAWSESDVVEIHRRHGVPMNPLYSLGAERVGCWPCIYARKSEVALIAKTDPDRIDLIEALEGELSAGALARGVERWERSFFNGAGPIDLGGDAATMPIRDVVQWSQTARGGRQMLLPIDDPDHGCVRWGMCEHPATHKEP